jgi:hypothetical protein
MIRSIFFIALTALMIAGLASPQLLLPLARHSANAQAAPALPISLDKSAIDAIKHSGTVPGELAYGTYLSGAHESGFSSANDWDETEDAQFNPTAGNTPDHHWVQTLDSTPVIFDLGSPSTMAVVFPVIDHGPMEPAPYEAFEFTVWGSNDPSASFPNSWTLATLSAAYEEGWVNTGSQRESDDFVSVWSFSGTFRYVAVYADRSVRITPDPWPQGGNDPSVCAGTGAFCSRDAEIDAVARPLGGLPQELVVNVALDVHPTSCPNPLNTNGPGTYPIAILGTASFDVHCIDVSSVKLEGVCPTRYAYADVATPFEPFTGKTQSLDCTTAGPDGFTDLTMKFDKQTLINALGPVSDRQVMVVHMTASLKQACGGGTINGQDVVIILKKK